MSRLPILRAVVLAAPLLLASGCASLGGNVKGSFACRAPEGTCAPTSAIDAGATGIEKANTSDVHRTVTPTGEAVRRLQVVLTPYRDAAGRDHEARVVHLTLPQQAGTGWRAPQGRREVLRSLASTIAATREGNPAPDFQPTDTLPEQLFIPSQPAPAMPGGDAPEPGGPGSLSSPREPVPHPETPEGESR
jgi:conjugal transfer pilus assembly protein TraV